ncbi:MAG: cobyric acid synthase [Methanonatronarchaeia archaeon]|nr:MAG: cobyric acid synthase [Methanonatronarchaeia archaeon]
MAEKTILVVATQSHAGKSTVAAGLCRALSRKNISVAPYKAQNMSNNARAVPSQTTEDGWGEIGVSQYVQARAAAISPNTDMNPVLLKPRGDGESQLVLLGEAVDHYKATDYYEEHWHQAREAAVEAYKRLESQYDVIVAEGAGSIGEINLHHRDLANIETARFTDADILLLADIERGGAFASLYGTVELMPSDIKQQVKGFIITKFRGQKEILEPGIEELTRLTDIPVLGVIPFNDPGLPEEDSVSLPPEGQEAIVGEDGTPRQKTINIGVVRLPRISNFTDFQPLAQEKGVKVIYLPIDKPIPNEVDALIIPGTKNTVDDLKELHKTGFSSQIKKFNGPILGVCGGYQMLGVKITNADIEGTDQQKTVEGIGLLPTETDFHRQKKVKETETTINTEKGLFKGAKGKIRGYEIHMGRTKHLEDLHQPLEKNSAEKNNAAGTYIHGLFENEAPKQAFINQIYRRTDKKRPETHKEKNNPYDKAADLIEQNIDLNMILSDPTT